MAENEYLIVRDLTSEVSQSNNEWRATYPPFGLTVREDTEEAARTRLVTAINLLEDALIDQGGIERVKARYNFAGVDLGVFKLDQLKDKTLVEQPGSRVVKYPSNSSSIQLH